MSIRETAMTRWYWEQRGGVLIEEFQLVPKSPGIARRLVDGLVILGEEKMIFSSKKKAVDISGKDVVAIQTKNSRLGMYLMGQTFFTARLLQSLKPRSIESVAVCAEDDGVMRSLLESCPMCKVIVCPPEICSLRT